MKEREISLLDLVVEVLLRWRTIVVVMLVGAILMGGFSYVNSVRSAAAQRTEIEEQKKLAAEQETQEVLLSERELTEQQIHNVNAALTYEKLYADKLAYQKNSVLMQLDALSVPTAEITFQVRSDDLERTYNIVKIYEDLLQGADLYNYLEEQCGVSSAVKELISLECTIYGQMMGHDTIRVTVVHSDEDTCQSMAEAMIAYVEAQQKELEKQVGAHEVSVLNCAIADIVNTDVLDSQESCEMDLISLNASAIELKSAFTKEEWYYYNNYLSEGAVSVNPDADKLKDATDEEAKEPAVAVITPGVSMKYVALGMILFAFVYVFIIFLAYIFNNKLRVTETLQNLYDIPQLGCVEYEKKRRFLGFIDTWILKLRYCGKRSFSSEEATGLVAVAVKVAAKNAGANSVCLVGCNLQENTLAVCNYIADALKQDEIEVKTLNNVLYDVEAMEELSMMQHVVLVETAASTMYSEIASELELMSRQNINVLGGIVVG